MAFDFASETNSGCYQCLWPQDAAEPQLNCSNSGVFGPVLGVIGSMQALEAMKVILQLPMAAAGYLQLFDAMTLQWQKLAIAKNPNCPVCANS